MASIDRKRKNKQGYHLKHQKSNNFIAWFGMLSNNSSSTVVSGCDSTRVSISTGVSASTGISSLTGVCASTKYTTPNRLLVASYENVSKINERIKILETTGDLELCTSLPSNNFRPMTTMMCHEYFVEGCDSEMTDIKQVDSIDLIVAMLKGLSLDDKRKIKESEMEHFESINTSK